MSSLLDDSLKDAIKDPYQSVSFTIKPVAQTGQQQQTQQQPFTPSVQSSLSATQQAGLTANPTLVSNPLGMKTDAAAEAGLAKLRQTFGQNYVDILRDVGQMGPGGFVPGLIETEAARRRYDLNYAMENASRGVNESALRGGSFFSGRRAFNLAQAQQPYTRDLARLEEDTARQLGIRLDDLMNLFGGFNVDRDVLLAELAQRLAAGAMQNPTGGDVAAQPGASTNPGIIQGRADAGLPNDANSYYYGQFRDYGRMQ